MNTRGAVAATALPASGFLFPRGLAREERRLHRFPALVAAQSLTAEGGSRFARGRAARQVGRGRAAAGFLSPMTRGGPWR